MGMKGLQEQESSMSDGASVEKMEELKEHQPEEGTLGYS